MLISIGKLEEISYVFNETVLQFFPAFLAVGCLLIENLQIHQIVAVNVAQGVEIDELFAEEKFQKFPGRHKR